MPTLLRLNLLPLADARLRPAEAPGHGWFLSLLGMIDPAWGAALHAPAPRGRAFVQRPFSLSPLYTPHAFALAEDDALPLLERLPGRDPAPPQERHTRSRPPVAVLLPAGEAVSLRVCLFHDADADRLVEELHARDATRNPDALPPLGGGAFPDGRTGQAPCMLTSIPVAVERGPVPALVSHPDRMDAPWEWLTAAPPARRIGLRFVTPTGFSWQKRDLFACHVTDLLTIWRRSWEAATGPSGPPPPDVPAEAGEMLVVREVEEDPLQRCTWSMKEGVTAGALGSLHLGWHPGAPERARSAAMALAMWAHLAGTGAHTALGLGQTRTKILTP